MDSSDIPPKLVIVAKIQNFLENISLLVGTFRYGLVYLTQDKRYGHMMVGLSRAASPTWPHLIAAEMFFIVFGEE